MSTLILTTIEGLGPLVEKEARILLGENIKDSRVFNDRIEIDVEDLTDAVIKLALFGKTFDGIYLKLAEKVIERKDDLYDVAREINWIGYWDITRSFAVIPATDGSIHKRDLGVLIGQAIVDHFIEKIGERPKVDLDNPQIQVYAFVENKKLTLTLDLCGFEFNSPEEILSRAIVVASEWNLEDNFGEFYYGGVAESAFELARNEANRSRIPGMAVFRMKALNPTRALELLRKRWRKEEYPYVSCYEAPGRINVVVMHRRYPIRVVDIRDAINADDKIFSSNIINVNPKKERQKQILEEITKIFEQNNNAEKLVIAARADVISDEFEKITSFKYKGVESLIAIRRK